MSKQKMIEGLLEAFEYAIRADSPEECAKQFVGSDHMLTDSSTILS